MEKNIFKKIKESSRKTKFFLFTIMCLILVSGMFISSQYINYKGSDYNFEKEAKNIESQIESQTGQKIKQVKGDDKRIKNPLTDVNPRRSFLNSTNDEVASIDHNGGINAIGNITLETSGSGYGFFNYLGSSANRIIKGWFTDIDVSNTANSSSFYQSGNKVIDTSSGTGELTDDNTFLEVAGDTGTGNFIFNQNLTVDTNTLFVDSNNDRVGIGTTSPEAPLHVNSGDVGFSGAHGTLTVEHDGIQTALQILSKNTSEGRLVFGDPQNGFSGSIDYNHSDNSMRFTTNGGGNERMRIDSSGKVGIGTSSPGRKLDVNGNITADTYFGDGSQLTGISSGLWSQSGNDIFYNQGNVGIGTDSPGEKLSVLGNTSTEGWVLNSINRTQEINTQGTFVNDIEFKPDGSRFFQTNTGDEIYQYSCTDNWNLSSCTYDNIMLSHDLLKDIEFKPDGSRFFQMGNDIIYQYSCSDGWNLSSCSYNNINLSFSSNDITGMSVKYDGTRMYIGDGGGNDIIHQYSCSDGWNLSSCSDDKINISTFNNPTASFFKSDGKTLYISVIADDNIYQYTCSTAWDLSSCSYDNINVSAEWDNQFLGIEFKPDGSRFYSVDSLNDSIYEYSMDDSDINSDGDVNVIGDVIVNGIIKTISGLIIEQGNLEVKNGEIITEMLRVVENALFEGNLNVSGNLTADGNVGIGTDSPSAKLTITGNTSSTTPAINLELENAQGGISAGSDEDWHEIGATDEPAFKNSWVNFDSPADARAAAFRKLPNGMVVLKGLIKSGTLDSPAFTLPAGYRPPGGDTDNMHFPGSSSGGFNQIKIDGLGNVEPSASGDGAPQTWTDLNGIRFYPEN